MGRRMGRVEIFQGRARRRWSEDDKRRLVAETLAPGETVHGVARRRGVSTSQLFTWRKRLRAEAGFPPSPSGVPGFAAVAIAPVPPPAGNAAGAPTGLGSPHGLCARARLIGRTVNVTARWRELRPMAASFPPRSRRGGGRERASSLLVRCASGLWVSAESPASPSITASRETIP